MELQEWFGHEDIATTQLYIDYQPSAQDGALIERAFGGGTAWVSARVLFRVSNLSESEGNSENLTPHKGAGSDLSGPTIGE